MLKKHLIESVHRLCMTQKSVLMNPVGWGTHLGTLKIQGLCTEEEAFLHISVLGVLSHL